MRWMKHLTLAHADREMAGILEEFGAQAYGVWWLILEDIAAPMEPGKFEPCAIHSKVKWAQLCHCSARTFTSIADRMAEKGLIEVKTIDNRIEITVHNLLKYKDEYSRKSGQTQDQDREQIEIEKQKERGVKKKPLPPPEPLPPKAPVPEPVPVPASDEVSARAALELVRAAVPYITPPPKIPVDFDGDVLFEELYSQHPRKGYRGMAQTLLAEAVAGGADPAEIKRVHRLCCPVWRRDRNPEIASGTLAQWLIDKGWRYPPEPDAAENPAARQGPASRLSVLDRLKPRSG